MLFELLLASLVLLSSPLVQVLDAEPLPAVGCITPAGGSCDSMSISKALSVSSSNQLASEFRPEVFDVSQDKKGMLHCAGSDQGVKNLSVSIFPNSTERFSMLLQWEPDANPSEHFMVDVKRSSNKRVLYRVTTSPGVSSLLLKMVYWYNAEELTVIVKTMSTGQCASLSLGVSHSCEAFIYNQHCSQRVTQERVRKSDVRVYTNISEEEDSQYLNLYLSWESKPNLDVMVTLSKDGQDSADCFEPDRNPPCFLVKDTNSVTVTHLNVSTNYTVVLHSFDPSPCLHPLLSHLFNGCGGSSCCRDYTIPLPMPSNVNLTSFARHSSSPGSQAPHTTPSPGSQAPLTTPSPESQAPLTTVSLDPPGTPSHNSTHTQSRGSHAVSTADESDGQLTITVVVPLVIVAFLVTLLALSVILYKYIKRRKRTPPPSEVATARTPDNSSTVSLPDIELSDLTDLSTRPYVTLSEVMPAPYPVPSPQLGPSVLVLYSPNTPKDEKEDIISLVVVGLRHCGIDAKSPDTCFSDSIFVWLEREVKSSTVLLVCNSALKADWESERPSQLICSLKQLLLGSLVEKGLSNYATVFLGEGTESGYVPTTYLKPQKQFSVQNFEDILNISHFVHQMPMHTTSL